MIKTIKVECPYFNQTGWLSFDIIDVSTLAKKEYELGIISKCSLSQEICTSCPHINLIGQKINI